VTPVDAALDRLLSERSGLVWALDFDGTLVDFAPRPALVAVPDELPRILNRLAQPRRHAVLVITGRAGDDVRRLLGPGFAGTVIGNHGADLVARHLRPPLGWRDELAGIVRRLPGTFLEDKGASLALHWREARDRRRAWEAARTFAARARHPLYLARLGAFVLDVAPSRATKGDALRFWLTTHYGIGWPRQLGVVAVGDDATDEDLFRAASTGLAVVVGTRTPTLARYRLASPAAVRSWLSRAARRQSS
jgi:trehalose 6-phosphate phosphatase